MELLCVNDKHYKNVTRWNIYKYVWPVESEESWGFDIALISDDGYVRVYKSKHFSDVSNFWASFLGRNPFPKKYK